MDWTCFATLQRGSMTSLTTCITYSFPADSVETAQRTSAVLRACKVSNSGAREKLALGCQAMPCKRLPDGYKADASRSRTRRIKRVGRPDISFRRLSFLLYVDLLLAYSVREWQNWKASVVIGNTKLGYVSKVDVLTLNMDTGVEMFSPTSATF